mgnify:CR=1 FL=1
MSSSSSAPNLNVICSGYQNRIDFLTDQLFQRNARIQRQEAELRSVNRRLQTELRANRGSRTEANVIDGSARRWSDMTPPPSPTNNRRGFWQRTRRMLGRKKSRMKTSKRKRKRR